MNAILDSISFSKIERLHTYNNVVAAEGAQLLQGHFRK